MIFDDNFHFQIVQIVQGLLKTIRDKDKVPFHVAKFFRTSQMIYMTVMGHYCIICITKDQISRNILSKLFFLSVRINQVLINEIWWFKFQKLYLTSWNLKHHLKTFILSHSSCELVCSSGSTLKLIRNISRDWGMWIWTCVMAPVG